MTSSVFNSSTSAAIRSIFSRCSLLCAAVDKGRRMTASDNDNFIKRILFITSRKREYGTNGNNGTDGNLQETFRLFRYFRLFRILYVTFSKFQLTVCRRRANRRNRRGGHMPTKAEMSSCLPRSPAPFRSRN